MADKTDGVLAWFDERIAEFVGAREGSIFWYRRRNALNARAKVAEHLAAAERVTAAFRALRRASPGINSLLAHEECEASMLALNEAIRAMRGDA